MRRSDLDGKRIDWKVFAPRGALAPTGTTLTKLRDSLLPWGFVYVFAAQNLVKIGMTQHSVYRRWHGIKSCNPWLEPPLYVSPPLFERVLFVEKASHTALAQYHMCGEWFECDRKLAIETVEGLLSAPSIGDGNVDRN